MLVLLIGIGISAWVDLAFLAWILAPSLDILLSDPSPSPAEHLSGSADPTAWLAGLLFQDVDRAGDHEHRDDQRHQRFHHHLQLGPPPDRGNVVRAEELRDPTAKGHVQASRDHCPQTSACCASFFWGDGTAPARGGMATLDGDGVVWVDVEIRGDFRMVVMIAEGSPRTKRSGSRLSARIHDDCAAASKGAGGERVAAAGAAGHRPWPELPAARQVFHGIIGKVSEVADGKVYRR